MPPNVVVMDPLRLRPLPRTVLLPRDSMTAVPPSLVRPMVFEVTRLEDTMTFVPPADAEARIPVTLLLATLFSTVSRAGLPAALLPETYPAKLLPVATVLRTRTSLLPRASRPVWTFSSQLSSMTARAAPPAGPWTKMPAKPLFRTTVPLIETRAVVVG